MFSRNHYLVISIFKKAFKPQDRDNLLAGGMLLCADINSFKDSGWNLSNYDNNCSPDYFLTKSLCYQQLEVPIKH